VRFRRIPNTLRALVRCRQKRLQVLSGSLPVDSWFTQTGRLTDVADTERARGANVLGW